MALSAKHPTQCILKALLSLQCMVVHGLRLHLSNYLGDMFP